MHALVVTGHMDLQRSSPSGLLVRQAMLMSAVRRAASRVTVLYYHHHDNSYQGGPWHDERLQEVALRNWGPGIELRVCRRRAPVRGGSLTRWVKRAWDFSAQPGFHSCGGEEQKAAFRAALALKPDFLFLHRLAVMPPVLGSGSPLPPTFFDLDDIEHIAQRRAALVRPLRFSRLVELIDIPGLFRAERAALRLADLTLVCSEADAEYLRDMLPAARVEAAQNSVAIPAVAGRSSNHTLLMVGNYAYGPNRLGAERFVREILPAIRAAIPTVKVCFAGPNGDQLAFAKKPPSGVEIPGFVADLADVYRQAAVVICPIYAGGGTRIKIVEAAAHRMPIVSTPLGAEGLPLTDGRDIVLAGPARQFAAECVRLLRDAEAADRLADSALQTALRHFDRHATEQRIASLFRDAVMKRAAG